MPASEDARLWQADTQYREHALAAVTRTPDGFDLEADGWHLYVPDPGWEPKVGDAARFYGRGVGFPVRGVVINDRTIYYRTVAEEEARHQEESAAFKRKVAEAEDRVKAAGRDERDMRETKAPTPETLEALSAYIASLTAGEHTYGTCCYAASLATTATFNYMAHMLGITGFQASVADLDVLRRTRLIDGPFMILQAHDALYPQCDPRDKLAEALERWQPWLAQEATKKLVERQDSPAHPAVMAHWQQLAQEEQASSPDRS